MDYLASARPIIDPAQFRPGAPPTTGGSSGFMEPQEINQHELKLLVKKSGQDLSPPVGYIVDIAAGTNKLWPIYPPAGHFLYYASPGSGKTTAILIPIALSHPGPILVFDGKGESYHRTAGARVKMGRNPLLLTPEGKTNVFNPIMCIRATSQDDEPGEYEERDAETLSRFYAPAPSRGDNAIFDEKALEFATAVTLFVRISRLQTKQIVHGQPISPIDAALPRERSLSEVARLLALVGLERRALIELMRASNRRLISEAGAMLADAAIGDGKLAMNIAQFASKNLRVFGATEVRRMTYKASSGAPGSEPAPNEIDFTTFRNGKDDLYVVFPLLETDRYAPILRVVLGMSVSVMGRVAPLPDRPPVNILIDEFPQLKTVDMIPSWNLFLRGFKIAVHYFVQSHQALTKWYPDSWTSFENVATKVFFGVNEFETAKHLSDYCGQATVASQSYGISGGTSQGTNWSDSTNSGFSGGYSTSGSGKTVGGSSTQEGGWTTTLAYLARPLMMPDEALRMGRSEMVMFVRGCKPIRGHVIPYFKFPDLNALAALPPPQRLPFADFLD